MPERKDNLSGERFSNRDLGREIQDRPEELGLYLPGGEYRSPEDIRRRALAEELDGSSRIVERSDFPSRRNFEDWTDIVVRRQEERREILGIPEHVTIEIESAEPIMVALVGDLHAGGMEVDYKRFAKDVDHIKKAGAYVITVGDLTDGYFFMPEVGEQIQTGDEQVLYAQAALDRLAEGDKLIAAFAGDHDLWAKDKMGQHTLYHQFHERYNAHYLEGVSYVTIGLNDGVDRVPYRMVGSHRHPGFSIYNSAHGALRQFRDEGVASDAQHVISFTAHNHRKGYLQQPHKVMGGQEVMSHNIALGAYKTTDRYLNKKGYPRADESSIGGFGVILFPGEERVQVYWTMEEAAMMLEQLKRK